MSDYRRFSTAEIEDPTKRPEVFSYQGALKAVGCLDGDVDGWYGRGSAKATRAFQQQVNAETGEATLPVDAVIGKRTATELLRRAEGFEASLQHRVMSVIAFYEVSNRADAFGMAEDDIGDGAGANYGIFQCNSLGSVVAMLKLASRPDLVSAYQSADKRTVNPAIQAWFGSTQGIATQVRYFEERIIVKAMRQLREFGAFDAWEHDAAMKTWWERAVLLFCDSVVQNGGMWSSKRRPFWTDLAGSADAPASHRLPELFHGHWWDELLGEHVTYDALRSQWLAEHEVQHGAIAATTEAVARRLVTDVIPSDDPAAQLVVLAQLRARSSAPKWWYRAVVSRRMTDATGAGEVNGRQLDLAADYQL